MTACLSVLLPTFDGERFVAEQVASILGQSLGDFELLVVDDGSRDATPAMLADIARQDRRVRLLPSTGNWGQKLRLAQLVDASAGELLAIADQDDCWAEDKLALLVNQLGSRDLAFGRSAIIDARGEPTGVTLLDLLPPPPSVGDRLIYLFKPMVSAHAAVARRAVYRAQGFARTHPFDWLQSLDAVFGRGLVYVPEAVTWHRLHDGNQSNARAGISRSWRGRWRLDELRRKRNLKLTERWMFVQRVEHLAFSPCLDEVTRAVFGRVHRLVSAHWFEQDRRWSLADRALATTVIDLLAPLAGSPSDLALAIKWMNRLCRANVHPINFAFHTAVTVLGPRRARLGDAATRS